jgi:HEAT repeat protein
VTPEQQRLVFDMAWLPGRGRKVSPEEFQDRTGIANPREWALQELRDAIDRQDADDAEAALAVGSVFGQDRRWSRPLIELLDSEWHKLHEDAAFTIGEVAGSEAVQALVRATHWVPEYLEYDEARALAVKAIHSLGKIPGREAETALRNLLEHEDHALRARVERVLEHRLANPPEHR